MHKKRVPNLSLSLITYYIVSRLLCQPSDVGLSEVKTLMAFIDHKIQPNASDWKHLAMHIHHKR